MLIFGERICERRRQSLADAERHSEFLRYSAEQIKEHEVEEAINTLKVRGGPGRGGNVWCGHPEGRGSIEGVYSSTGTGEIGTLVEEKPRFVFA
jgi:hypothetical protein